ncbi:MAG: autotransporter-associated beta strand repeat-containing protein, partial [Verrucomicrobiota bacterium]
NVVNGAQTSNVYVGGKINNGGSIGLGVLNISGTLNVPAGSPTGVNGDGSAIWLNPYGRSGNSTLNLDSGGLLNTARPVAEGAVANGSIFNFDGGTLKSTYTGGSILQNSIYNVRNGGAIIDSASTNISLSFPLLHSSIGGDRAVDGGLTKTGNGTLTLSAVNTYTGNTTVNAGTLSITHACLADASTVTIASTAKLDLNFGSVSDTVANLIIGTTVMPAGNYGATGSGATTIDDTHFSGVGTLTVTSGGGYASWAHDQGLTGDPGSELDPAFNADPNKDGIQNGMAWILGAGALGDPAANLLKLPAVSRDGSGALVLTFDRLASSAASAPLVVQYGEDLGGWAAFPVGTSDGSASDGSISIAVALGAGSTAEYDRVSVTIPATYMAAHPKTFARLAADMPP